MPLRLFEHAVPKFVGVLKIKVELCIKPALLKLVSHRNVRTSALSGTGSLHIPTREGSNGLLRPPSRGRHPHQYPRVTENSKVGAGVCCHWPIFYKRSQVGDKVFINQGRNVQPTVSLRRIAEVNHDFVRCPGIRRGGGAAHSPRRQCFSISVRGP